MKKLILAIGLPVGTLILAIGTSIVMNWLETFPFGVMLQAVLAVAILTWVAYLGWTWADALNESIKK